jgi:hypothetical protein
MKMIGQVINSMNQLCILQDIDMHPDDLKAIWICHECRTVFVFHTDIEDHKDLRGHKLIEKMMILPAETLA